MKREDLKKAFELNKKIEKLEDQIELAKRRLVPESEINLYSVEETYNYDTYNQLIFSNITLEELSLIIKCREERLEELKKELEGIL